MQAMHNFILAIACVLFYNKTMLKLNPIFENEMKNSVFALALSGGRDSVALAHLMKSSGLKFYAVNVEHGIRGESSVSDSRFVAEFCKDMGIELRSFSVDAVEYARLNKMTIEESARALRYDILRSEVDAGRCDFVVTAHHKADQAESILMHILRGSGLDGIRGMSAVAGYLARPILDSTRQDIDDYILVNKLEFVEDETNRDTNYARNFVRSELKNIEKHFAGAENALIRLSENAREMTDFVDSQIDEIEVVNGQVEIEFCDSVLFKRKIKKALVALNAQKDFEKRHFDILLGFVDAENGKMLNLPNDIVLIKSGNKFILRKQNEDKKIDEIIFAEELIGGCAVYGIKFDTVRREEFLMATSKAQAERAKGLADRTLYFDFDKAKGALIRQRLDGDTIAKFGGGTKNLGDFLTDNKILKQERDNMLVLADESCVYAVFGLEISRYVAVDKDTKQIVRASVAK